MSRRIFVCYLVRACGARRKTIVAWANVGAPVSCGDGDEPDYVKGKEVHFNRHRQKRLIAWGQLNLKEIMPCLSMAFLR